MGYTVNNLDPNFVTVTDSAQGTLAIEVTDIGLTPAAAYTVEYIIGLSSESAEEQGLPHDTQSFELTIFECTPDIVLPDIEPNYKY